MRFCVECMDRRRRGQPERKAAAATTKKRGRDEEVAAAAPPPPCGAVDFPFEEGDEEAAAADVVGDQAPGVFRFPWQSCRGGLGVVAGGGGGGGGWEMRDVFFRSLVDGGAAAIGVPGDRLVSPPPPAELRRALFDDVGAWLAAAGDGEVDPVWRSALLIEGEPPAPATV